MSYIKKILLLPLFVQICIGSALGIEQESIRDKSQCNTCDKNHELDEYNNINENTNLQSQNNIQSIVVSSFLSSNISSEFSNSNLNNLNVSNLHNYTNIKENIKEDINILTSIWISLKHFIEHKTQPYYVFFQKFDIKKNDSDYNYYHNWNSFFIRSTFDLHYSQFYSQLILIP